MAELTKEKFRPVDRSRFDSDAIVRPTVTYWQDAWRRLRKNPIAVFSMILLLTCVLFITLGPTISGEEYVSINAVMKNKPADGTHWFGTDILGKRSFQPCLCRCACFSDRCDCVYFHSDRRRLRIRWNHGIFWRMAR